MTQKIGLDFTKSYHLSLLPGVVLAKGYWQVDIRFMTDTGGVTTQHYGAYNCGGELHDWEAIVGCDVYQIEFRVHRHNSYPGYPNTRIHYVMRLDRLIMLNFVERLVGSTIKI